MRTLLFDIEPYYRVEYFTDTGTIEIYSDSIKSKGVRLSQWLNSSGYLNTKLKNKHIPVHRIIAKLFLGEPEPGLVVNHKDGNKLNNRIENLEYVTIAENIKHAVASGLHVSGNPENHGNYKDGRATKINQKEYQRNWQRNKLGILPENYRK